MEIDMKDNLKKINILEKENIIIILGIGLMDFGRMTKRMGMSYCIVVEF
jgi:hypothetical protein